MPGMCRGRFLDVGMVRAHCWNFEMALGYWAVLRFITAFRNPVGGKGLTIVDSVVICLCVHTSGCTDFLHNDNSSPCPLKVLITDIKLCSMLMVELISLPVIDTFVTTTRHVVAGFVILCLFPQVWYFFPWLLYVSIGSHYKYDGDRFLISPSK